MLKIPVHLQELHIYNHIHAFQRTFELFPESVIQFTISPHSRKLKE